MKGDFSRWKFDDRSNAHGVLHQQGRVLLDADWNTQTRLLTRWQDEAVRATIGADVAAVAAEWRDSFKVTQATVTSPGTIELTLNPGQLWADGWLAYLQGDAPDPSAAVERQAVFLGEPFQSLPADPAAAGTRDAVVLELNREALNGFQVPEQLIEAALGGPDTTERLQAAFALRLYRLGEDDTCDTVADALEDDLSGRGKLTVSLQDTVITPGDCPVVHGGGYTGFEHNLYRIEIAEVGTASAPMFKWSQFNGGLVGRGTFDATTRKLKVTANRQAILRSGLQDFYLEVLEPEPDRPPGGPNDPELSAALAERWKLVYGARVSLANDDEIDLPAPGNPNELFGSIPGPSNRRFFFRLWNDVQLISDFPAAAENQLRDGIQLEFDASGDYLPYDFWTFEVRAGGVENEQTLIDAKPPEGVRRVRVPLAILNWTGGASPITAATGEIEDCRRIFQPLTRLSTCCTLRVGDGVHSHGDYDTITEALANLPATGGRICVLPGEYHENLLIDNSTGVSIIGCGNRSRVISRAPAPGTTATEAPPVFHVRDSQEIRIESLAITAHSTGIGVLVEETDPRLLDPDATPPLPVYDVRLAGLEVEAATRSGIEVRGGTAIEIVDNLVEMDDVAGQWPAVAVEAEDVLIEHNILRVEPNASSDGVNLGPSVHLGVGGLWLRGDSRRIRVIDNLIEGGIGNGITLGHVEMEVNGDLSPWLLGVFGWAMDPDDPCWPCPPGFGRIPPGNGTPEDPAPVAGPPLEEIHIERNRILQMGLNGITVIGFFEDEKQGGLIVLHELTIIDNLIRDCLQVTAENPLESVLDEMVDRFGFGGVVLADVTLLYLRDNRIEDNGHNHLEPICGVYVQHGEGVDISQNYIIANGKKTDQRAANARQGPRGGVFIQLAVAPTFEIDGKDRYFPNVRGIPAVKVHDNVVSAPLGRALTINALGPVSVVANQLTSHGVTGSSALASTVQILNLGVAIELLPLLAATFIGLWTGKAGTARAAATEAPDATATGEEAMVYGTPVRARAGFALTALSRALFNGNVLFANNQVLLELLDRGYEAALSSVAVFSLDDVAIENNQCDCELLDDLVFFNSLVLAVTSRVTGNRFKEGLFNAFISGLTYGFLNTTTHNQGTHCIFANRLPGGDVIRQPNQFMVESPALSPLMPQFFRCGYWREMFEKDG